MWKVWENIQTKCSSSINGHRESRKRTAMKDTKQKIEKYLDDFAAGRIKMGERVGISKLDNHLRYKQGQFNLINGFDNVGKTTWIAWYLLLQILKNDKKIAIWSGENHEGTTPRWMVQFYCGEKFKDISKQKRYNAQARILDSLQIADNSNVYKPDELFAWFKETDADICLIDPFTGLNRNTSHDANYQFLNESRQFVNTSGKTLYVNTHPNTAAAREKYGDSDMVYGHPVMGEQKAPGRENTEGGQPFANRPDDIITIHRFTSHEQLRNLVQVHVRKVKDIETGGRVTSFNDPVWLDWNDGLGFKCHETQQQPIEYF